MRGAVPAMACRPGSSKSRFLAIRVVGLLPLLPLLVLPVHAETGRATLSVGATVAPACTASTRPGVGVSCSGGAPQGMSVSREEVAISKAVAAVDDGEPEAKATMITVTF